MDEKRVSFKFNPIKMGVKVSTWRIKHVIVGDNNIYGVDNCGNMQTNPLDLSGNLE